MKRYLKSSILLAFAVSLLSCKQTDAQEVGHISVKEVHDLVAKDTNVFLLDVRTEDEYASAHLRKAYHIPVDELASRIGEIPTSKKVIAYCRTGNRSEHASEILKQHNIAAPSMDGGILEWEREGFETESSSTHEH